LPAGTAAWITPELVISTLDTWQSHFPKALTVEEAIEIVMNVGHLFDALEE
jgi:hypothetical protein